MRQKLTPTHAQLFGLLVDERAPVAFRGCDGSRRERSGAIGSVEIRRPRALRYLATAPGELGLARAYVAGDIEVRGDLHATLSALLKHRRDSVAWGQLARAVRPWMLRRPPPPPEEAPARWRGRSGRDSRPRDAQAISHHYDLSNRFYELVLGRSMAYSCAVFATPETRLDDAQREKFDLVCRKLDLRAGQRLL